MNNTYLRYLVLPIIIFYLAALTPYPSWAEEKGASRMAAQEPLILPPQEEGKIIPQEKSISTGKPFYKTWWFWTIVVLAAGGAAAAAGSGGGGGGSTTSPTPTTGTITVTVPSP